MKFSLAHLLGTFAFAASIGSMATAQLAPLPTDSAIRDAFQISDWSIQSLQIPSELTHHASVSVEIEGREVELRLSQHSLRAPDFTTYVIGADGIPVATDVGAARTFRGVVPELQDSLVVASMWNDGLQATIRIDGSAKWCIQPLTEVDPSVDSALHIVYSCADLLPAEWTVETISRGVKPIVGGGFYGTGMKLAEIAFDSDVELYVLNGSSVASTVNDIELTLNSMSAIYETDCQLTYQVTAIIVRTAEPDPYTGLTGFSLITEFDTEMTGPLAFLHRDVAHLVTGKDMGVGYGGAAWYGGTCTPGGGHSLSVPHFTSNLIFRTAVATQMLGANWDCGPCDNQPGACRIMCSVLGNCAPDITRFGPWAIGQITSNLALRPCVDDLALPRSVPFLDSFSNDIDVDNWPVSQGASTNQNGVNEPSGVHSLNLAAASTHEYADDFIRSNYFLLGAQAGLTFSYWTEHIGVEVGEELVLEFTDATGAWIELDRVTSDGTQQSAYVEQSVTIPAAAYHDLVQFQFRAEVSDSTDDWFIDDVSISSSCAAPTSYCTPSGNSFSASGAQMSFTGSASLSANDLTLVCNDAVPTQFGIFYFGPNQVQATFGEGFRCIGGSTTRMPLQTVDALGVASRVIDVNGLPGGATFSPSQSVNWQYWFRDPAGGGAGFNLSDGLNTVWCP